MEVPVDVGEVGDVTGRHHGVEELHGLHGRDAGQPAQKGSRDKQGGALEHHHRLVAQPISEQEHWHQQC